MVTRGYPPEIDYRRLEKFLDPCFPLLLGLGQTTPWSIEGVPPQPDVTVVNLPELLLYYPIPIKKAIVQEPFETENTVVLGGRHIRFFEDVTIEDIREHQIHKIYLEVKIDHNTIPALNFRSLGVFIINHVLDIESIKSRCYKSYLPLDVSTIPLYYENFPPIEVQEDVMQTFKLIIEV